MSSFTKETSFLFTSRHAYRWLKSSWKTQTVSTILEMTPLKISMAPH
uniref:Uncharacterized protein n=1 Tax=Rhizophora mucronata TaxID=61149 RepID=A0A2P2R123_RHIMU